MYAIRVHHCLRTCWLIVVTAFLVVTLPRTIRAQENVLFSEDFESGAVGWSLGSNWEVRELDGNHILSGQGHQWANPPDSAYFNENFRIQFRILPLSGHIHLNYKLNDIGRYFIGFGSNGTYLSKQVWDGGFFEGLAGTEITYASDMWHTIEIFGKDNTMALFVDDVLAWVYEDPEPLTLPASFAFETLDDGHFYLDDIIVYEVGADAVLPDPFAISPEGASMLELPVGGAALSTEPGWIRTGGPLGGLGYDIRMHPENPDRMYVTDAYAGVHMSADGGKTWTPSNQGITVRLGSSGDSIPIFCLTIDSNNPDTIWAGTDGIRGIFKSTDGGQTWTQMNQGVIEYEGITFRGFTVDPQDSDIVYGMAELASWTWAGVPMAGREFDRTKGVVYRTTDGGQNWVAIWRGNNLARYLWIDPRDSDVLYLSTGIFDRESANSDPDSNTPGGEGILKSEDGGQTWTPINNGIENLYVGSLFMHSENPDILLAGAHNNAYYAGNGVYRTIDGGESWQHVLNLPEYGGEIESVEFAISNPQIAYAGGANAFFRSEDGGVTWTQMVGGDDSGWGPPGVRAGFPIDLQVDPRDPNRIFANNYGGGNFVSEDGGKTWTVASMGYTGAQTRDIAVDPTDSGRVYAAARSGIFFSADGGGDWIGLNYPPAVVLEWYAVAIDPADPLHMLAANNWQGTILDSHSGGARWRQVGDRTAGNMAFRAFAFAPSDTMTVYAGVSAFFSAGMFDNAMPAGGIWVSRDGGVNWEAANDEQSQDANVTALAVSPDDPNVVYAATGNYDVLKSMDGGVSWQGMNLGLATSPRALSIVIHPTDSNIVFAGLERAGVVRTDNAGASWRLSGSGLNPEAAVSDIVFDPANPQVIYLSDRFSGVYRSTDGGTTWQAINDGLRMRDVNALAISSDGMYLYAATEGEGVYRLFTPSR